MQNPELLKGTLITIILKLLTDNERMYGYEITQKVKELTGGTLLLTEGALYPTLHKLESEGLVETEIQNLGKRSRKYYRLTSRGKITSDKKIAEFIMYIRTVSQILKLDWSTAL